MCDRSHRPGRRSDRAIESSGDSGDRSGGTTDESHGVSDRSHRTGSRSDRAIESSGDAGDRSGGAADRSHGVSDRSHRTGGRSHRTSESSVDAVGQSSDRGRRPRDFGDALEESSTAALRSPQVSAEIVSHGPTFSDVGIPISPSQHSIAPRLPHRAPSIGIRSVTHPAQEGTLFLCASARSAKPVISALPAPSRGKYFVDSPPCR